MTWTQFAIYAFLAWTARAVYKDAMHALRTFPMRLRFRRPVDGGEGRESTTCLVECVKPKRHANRSDARVAREQAKLKAQQRAMANRLPPERDFHNWMDEHGIQTPTVFEYEALRENWRRNQMAPRPTPAENARRYAAEGGTW